MNKFFSFFVISAVFLVLVGCSGNLTFTNGLVDIPIASGQLFQRSVLKIDVINGEKSSLMQCFTLDQQGEKSSTYLSPGESCSITVPIPYSGSYGRGNYNNEVEFGVMARFYKIKNNGEIAFDELVLGNFSIDYYSNQGGTYCVATKGHDEENNATTVVAEDGQIDCPNATPM